MTDRQAPSTAQVAACATAALDQAEAELVRLRAHIAALATDPAEGVEWTAARSARIVAGLTGDVADQLRDLTARQSVAAGN